MRKQLKGKLRLPRIPVREAWQWVRERTASVWTDHRETSLRVGRHLAIVGCFVLVVLLIHRELYSVLGSRTEYSAPGAATLAGAEGAPRSMVDDEMIERIGRRLEQDPWVKRVVEITRVYPDKIRVKIERRKPHVAVETSAGHLLVDEDLVRLPGKYVSPPGAVTRPVVTGVKESAPEPGVIWNSKSLAAGVEMAELCAQNPTLRALRVCEVDVSDRSGCVVLATQKGSEIRWGRVASQDSREISVEEKVNNLRVILGRFPHLEGLEYAMVNIKDTPTIKRRDARNVRR